MARSKDADSILKMSKEKGIDLKMVGQIMDSPEGKALLKQLSGSGGDALKHAASKAAEGEEGAAGRLLGTLMSSKEGQALAKQVMDIKKKNS